MKNKVSNEKKKRYVNKNIYQSWNRKTWRIKTRRKIALRDEPITVIVSAIYHYRLCR